MIVQKTTLGGDALKLANLVQGNVIKEFRLLPAFVLDVPPAKLLQLAADPIGALHHAGCRGERVAARSLMLERNPGLKPDQVKQILTSTARDYPGQPDKAGSLNIVDALVSAVHPPKESQTFQLPLGALVPPLGKTSALWDGSRWSSAGFDGSRWSNDRWD